MGVRTRRIKLWDVHSQGEIATLTGHSLYINSVAFSPDGRTLASGSWDTTIKLWDVHSQGENCYSHRTFRFCQVCSLQSRWSDISQWE
ncbi:WD40 repeat domain-containing protein [Planktothrix agardhii]|uniref:WD40 repeat domain-containing protein n=1 Tax=Planktothrix agardhii TaxID=1160 RepID=UPI000907519D|nr:hypothetical protein [Planktothrix agardhii]